MIQGLPYATQSRAPHGQRLMAQLSSETKDSESKAQALEELSSRRSSQRPAGERGLPSCSFLKFRLLFQPQSAYLRMRLMTRKHLILTSAVLTAASYACAGTQ